MHPRERLPCAGSGVVSSDLLEDQPMGCVQRVARRAPTLAVAGAATDPAGRVPDAT
jgi:hypothetical protein